MDSKLSPDKENNFPPIPLKTYQWEDLRRARKAGGYPWTHISKAPLEGEITAEDIIRATSPRRSMSREFTKSRTHSPDKDVQKILILDSSPGSSRKHNEEGKDEGIHIPNFSKEISLDSGEDVLNQIENISTNMRPESQNSTYLVTPVDSPMNISPKSILKRRAPEQQYIGMTETREKTKCCHPLVNKIKHLADRTLHKLEKNECEKSPLSKRKKNEESQEIRQLKNSPSAVRRQKFSAVKLGDSDEMSKTMSIDTPPPRKRKEHIYEDIEESKGNDALKSLQIRTLNTNEKNVDDERRSESNKENDSILEKKSNASQDPSLFTEDNVSLKADEHIMELLHHRNSQRNRENYSDLETDGDEPNVDEVFLNQVDDSRPNNDSPNITITEIIEDDTANSIELSTTIPIETSPSPSPRDHVRKQNEVEFYDKDWSKPSSTLRRWTSEGGTPTAKPLRQTREGSVQLYTPEVRCACQYFQCDSLLPERVNPVGTRPTSRASNIMLNGNDHEYEIIEKPPPNIIYTAPSVDEQKTAIKAADELSSTTSLNKKYLQHSSDDEDQIDDNENFHDEKNEGIFNAETLQKDIEDRFFVNTPSTVSRTECEVSTSQVDSSALENLPLKRDSRNKHAENLDSKIQQRIKEGTGKLKTQAGKLKTKLQNMKTKQFSFPERPKFKMPERPKISFPDRSKFTLPDKRKFSLPDRPKFKKINISEKLSFGDRKKFTLPERPRFPDMPKFKMPERPRINFPSLGRKKNSITNNISESTSDLQTVATVDFETKTYPRLFNRKKKSQIPKTSSSPTLNREETPPPTFTFTRVKNTKQQSSTYIPDSPEQPREYGTIDSESNYESESEGRKQFDTRYDFDKVDSEYLDQITNQTDLKSNTNATSTPDISPSVREYTHINELNNDEFFVRPRGISRENIQVREYLSDEIRQAFNIPKNVLAVMGSNTNMNINTTYANNLEADSDLTIGDNEELKYSIEDINERDDGYYTFPPIRPSRAKRKKKEAEGIQYIDDSMNVSMQFSEVDLGLSPDQFDELHDTENMRQPQNEIDLRPPTDLRSIHEYANDDVIEYPESMPIQSQTLPMPPKRKKKLPKTDLIHSSLKDFNNFTSTEMWPQQQKQSEDIIVYRTEHEYIVPRTETDRSPMPPVRNRSRSSRATSLCDDDRTSHGAESLTLDTHLITTDDIQEREIRHESPGYATVDKGPYLSSKNTRRSTSKTPPARRRKSNSSVRKYYTVSATKSSLPDRPPRKKSSTSLLTLDSLTKGSINEDYTQYVEIDKPRAGEVHKDLKSGEILSKMKDRPLPPPPRPPRGPKRKKDETDDDDIISKLVYTSQICPDQDIIEIEVSTQTDPLPDDVDFELGLDDHLDISMSSSLKDIIDEESIIGKNLNKVTSSRISRSGSRSEKSLKLSDPKISELSKAHIGRTSPTVILVEKRVSSPTRINETEEILTEASLTVQHIDIDESQIPDVPPLPRSRGAYIAPSSNISIHPGQESAIQKISCTSRDVQLDNLITQRLQVRDLDVGRLNVSELQASKILVSEIEGMTLNVTELDSKSGHISVSGIELSQSVIDEIVKKFAEISTASSSSPQARQGTEMARPEGREEETQTDASPYQNNIEITNIKEDVPAPPPPPTFPPTSPIEETTVPPQRPPPPDLAPLLFSYLQDIASAPKSVSRSFRERPITEFIETQYQSPPPPTRRVKRKPAITHTETSSDEDKPRPSPRRLPPPGRVHEPTISEAGAQFFRVCHSSISRTIRNIFNTFMSYISRAEDKKDVQMAMVIFLVLIAGLIMFGLSDSRTIHHHHWEFFNPPDSKM